MPGGISQNNIDFSISKQIKSSTSNRKVSHSSKTSGASAGNDIFIASEQNDTSHLQTKLTNLSKKFSKEKLCTCQDHRGEKNHKKVHRKFKQGHFHYLLSKAYFTKLRASSIMAKVELEISSAVDARDAVLRGISLTGKSLEYEIAKLDKQCGRFLRLGNFFRKNVSMENNYKLNEENLNFGLDLHC